MEQVPPNSQAQNGTSSLPQASSQPLNQSSVQPSIDPMQIGQGVNPQSTNSEQKMKRHRRSKNDNDGRNFKCPDCGKCYLSAPALTNHRKTKHDYGKDGEKKGRGRPRKEPISTNLLEQAEDKYRKFFENDLRKLKPTTGEQQNGEGNSITLETVKQNMKTIHEMCKTDLFPNVDSIETYSFYKLLVDNWDKETPEIGNECYSAIIKANEPSKVVSTCALDGIFFKFLKEVSLKTNKDYFWFIIKFVIIFRECINKLRENLVKAEHTTETKKLYTEIYNAETIPDICNDFFIDFMEPHQFFGLNINESIELIQYFCYWLYKQNYTQSHLTLMGDGK